MAVATLRETEYYASRFRRYILSNLQFWLDYVLAHKTDVTALDSEWEAIVRAIWFAVAIEEAWSPACKLIVVFSFYMERRGHWEMWHGLLRRAIETAQQVEDLAGEAELSGLLARLLQRQSRLKEATKYYRRVIRLSRRVGDCFGQARACTNLGYLYIVLGRWQRAEVLCCYALAIFERIDNNHGRAHTESHLGFLYTRQRLWDKARQCLERACALWRAMGDNHGLMRGFINLSALYLEMEMPDQALLCLEKALHQAELTGEEAEIGAIYESMGIAHRLKGKGAKAETYIRRAEAIFRRFSNIVELARVWNNLGMACLDQGKWQEAGWYLNAALEMWRDLNNRDGEIRTLMDIVSYELARENWTEAARRLDELEHLIAQHSQGTQFHHLQLQLTRFRHSLAGHSTRPVVAN